jgi:hypothetical protein
MNPTDENLDADLKKGAVEQEDPKKKGQTSLNGQLGHRDQDPLIKGNDTDFPEPDGKGEHTGQSSLGEDPHRRHKKDDPLAA